MAQSRHHTPMPAGGGIHPISSLLDRTLLYTAVTRAVETVVIVGDPEVLRRTIEEPPTALDRSSSMSLEAEQ